MSLTISPEHYLPECVETFSTCSWDHFVNCSCKGNNLRRIENCCDYSCLLTL